MWFTGHCELSAACSCIKCWYGRTCYLLLVAFARQHDELHGVGHVVVSLACARLPGASLLQLTLQLQRDRHVQLMNLHRLAASLLQRQKDTNISGCHKNRLPEVDMNM